MNTIDRLSTLDALNQKQTGSISSSNDDFSKILSDSISEVNDLQVKGDEALADIATGEVKNLHQAALAINKAETSMKLMLEVRNKAISMFQEISKTQI